MQREAKVTKIRRDADDIVTIYFRFDDGVDFSYKSGQYITVFFDDSSTPEGKAYSLSSAPHEKDYSITVKKIGEYSGRLHDLKVGDTFSVSMAYGFFNPETSRPLVCIAAGCGISPIWSIVKSELHEDASRVAHIFFSNRTAEGIPFHEALDEHAKRHPAMNIHHHITRSEKVPVHMHKGRIDLDACVQAVEDEAHYLVCGSVDFVRDTWRGLTERGVTANSISTETFFE